MSSRLRRLVPAAAVALLGAWVLAFPPLRASAVAPGGAATAAPLPAPPAAASRSEDPCDINGVERIVAVGDVHGAHDAFVAILREAAVIDEKGRWAGGATHFVQTGDVVDRGPHSRKILDLLMRLEREAPKAGGRVHALLGNHEVAVMLGDLRSVNPLEYEEFRTPESEGIRDRYYEFVLEEARHRAAAAKEKLDERAFRKDFLAKTPLGFVERRIAFGPTGTYGRWLRERNTVARINQVLFLHAAISPRVIPYGCQGINEKVRAELTTDLERAIAAPRESLIVSEDGPLFYRVLAQLPESGSSAPVDSVLSSFHVRSMIGGHSVVGTGRIESRFRGTLLLIDTGMLSSVYRGGQPSALEIKGDVATAIYLTGRDVLPFGGAGLSEPGSSEAGRRAADRSNLRPAINVSMR